MLVPDLKAVYHCQVYDVIFGAGQLLLCTDGTGYYQREASLPGDLILYQRNSFVIYYIIKFVVSHRDWKNQEEFFMSKKLATYFSASGVTAAAAKVLAEAANADLYEIKAKVLYTDADLNWNNKQSRSTIEMKDPSSRPAIVEKDANIAAYDVIFVGFPIWWYIAPTIINTFLERYDFSGKLIVPFATSGSSGLGRTVEKLKPSVSDTAVWKEGKLLSGRTSRADLSAWVESLNL